MTRREVLRWSAALGLSVGAGGTTGLTMAAARGQEIGGELVIGVYGGAWETAFSRHMADPFKTMHPDVTTTLDLTSPPERFAKLRAANGESPPYDIFTLSPELLNAAMSEELLEPFTAEEVPSVNDLYDISRPAEWQKDGSYYAVYQNWGQLGITYRSDKVQNPPMEWLDLWKPDYEGLVAIPPLTYSAGLQFFIAVVRALGGHEENPSDIDEAFSKLNDLKPNVAQTPATAGSIQQLLERGDIGIVPLWDGRAFELATAGLPIGFSYTTNPGPIASGAGFAIAKGTSNRAATLAMLDFQLSPEPQKAFCQAMWYAPSNTKVQLDEQYASRVQYGQEAYEALIHPDYNVVAQKLGEWNQRWIQVFGS